MTDGFGVEQGISPENEVVYYVTVQDFTKLIPDQTNWIQVGLKPHCIILNELTYISLQHISHKLL